MNGLITEKYRAKVGNTVGKMKLAIKKDLNRSI